MPNHSNNLVVKNPYNISWYFNIKEITQNVQPQWNIFIFHSKRAEYNIVEHLKLKSFKIRIIYHFQENAALDLSISEKLSRLPFCTELNITPYTCFMYAVLKMCHSQGRRARVQLSSLFPQISKIFSYFPSNFTYFLPHFGPPDGQVAHPGRPWLHHWPFGNMLHAVWNCANFCHRGQTTTCLFNSLHFEATLHWLLKNKQMQ